MELIFKFLLTLPLPIFWQFWFLFATFIFNARGIIASQAYTFSKIWIFLYSSLNINNLKYESRITLDTT